MSQQDSHADKEKDKEKQFHFFVDGKKYETEHATLTGADIKRIAGVTATYQLFWEAEDESPDLAVSDGESLDLHKTKHFYAVPPATFGA